MSVVCGTASAPLNTKVRALQDSQARLPVPDLVLPLPAASSAQTKKVTVEIGVQAASGVIFSSRLQQGMTRGGSRFEFRCLAAQSSG